MIYRYEQEIESNAEGDKMVSNDSLDKVLAKAQTLSEALPYIQRFNGSTIVVKYGGSAMLDENLKYNVIKDVALLKLIGMKPIIVHGGGKEINKWLGKINKQSEFVNGLRVTDEETLEVAEMVLNKVNKSLVAMMTQLGLKAVGISGKDAGLLQTHKKTSDGKDIGYVGEVISSDTKILDTLIHDDFIPVIAPIGLGDDFHGYNINAEKLVFLTDIEGVFVDPSDKKTLVSEMNVAEAEEFIEKGVVGGGMMPKLQNCIEALKKGVSRVHILDGRVEHCLLLEFFTEKGIGTAILKDPLF